MVEYEARIIGGGMWDYLTMISRPCVHLDLHRIFNIL
jgi:hypothetical protein